MNSFDKSIETFFSGFNSCVLCNHAVQAIADMYTFKGLVLIPVLWWIWFQSSERRQWRREVVIATTVSGLLALLVGRLLAHFLPFRTRPAFSPELHLHFPFVPQSESLLSAWSSFPSDHAMLWVSVAVGIFIVSRRVGMLALLYVAIFICIPRAYLGFHYPTDLLGGAVIGIVITYIMTRDSVRAHYATHMLRWIDRYPGPSAMLGFVLCVELVTQFDELRAFATSVLKVV
ncbi:phosphatase PAP2 family protein [Paraburkholderia kirstenboschensis]|jgi:undecaprenyl-diphosphatase|uniref:Phosphatase PAP2 family protein n=1 Tax=Paraburkholderia kirstenboschensis TaxID=1245436 RepID=A0ABZ0EG97_9BURK|nr:phosphatase PAP2 family protein [Paraburkholderia kirstenboschensis]WOD16211.1 phosphatase PAP2 family protein [Paraburkholderia kirstenboschensis]